MSSSPRADTGRSRFRSPRTWSLRARLLASQIVLLALVCAAIGAGTEFALQRFLTSQLDERLAEAGRRSVGLFEFGPPLPPPGMGPMAGYPDPPRFPRHAIRDDYG
ncbi:MAG: two-component system, OmpR family, sensor kinase, partial [Mycobacterium sp.]|nr:two-component system, OmpR family, sensor kinase [Mycobacterium sp.]